MTELRKFVKIHNEIIQKQLQMSMIEKYLKKGIDETQKIVDDPRLV